ncbi:TPA: hypothetical protein OEL43_003034 [Escherichia coli]|nr:hypothetical protein [Escherichia coli]
MFSYVYAISAYRRFTRRLVSGEWRKLNIGTVVIAVALVTFYAGGWAI